MTSKKCWAQRRCIPGGVGLLSTTADPELNLNVRPSGSPFHLPLDWLEQSVGLLKASYQPTTMVITPERMSTDPCDVGAVVNIAVKEPGTTSNIDMKLECNNSRQSSIDENQNKSNQSSSNIHAQVKTDAANHPPFVQTNRAATFDIMSMESSLITLAVAAEKLREQMKRDEQIEKDVVRKLGNVVTFSGIGFQAEAGLTAAAAAAAAAAGRMGSDDAGSEDGDEDGKMNAAHHHRIRSLISGEHRQMLKEFYRACPRPSKNDLESIVARMSFPKRVIQVWFQNMRARDRRKTRIAHNFSHSSQSSVTVALTRENVEANQAVGNVRGGASDASINANETNGNETVVDIRSRISDQITAIARGLATKYNTNILSDGRTAMGYGGLKTPMYISTSSIRNCRKAARKVDTAPPIAWFQPQQAAEQDEPLDLSRNNENNVKTFVVQTDRGLSSPVNEAAGGEFSFSNDEVLNLSVKRSYDEVCDTEPADLSSKETTSDTSNQLKSFVFSNEPESLHKLEGGPAMSCPTSLMNCIIPLNVCFYTFLII